MKMFTNNDSSKDFWQTVEHDLGCPVISYGLAQYQNLAKGRSSNDRSNGIWGLFYVSQRGLHFYHFPQQSSLGALMKIPVSRPIALNLFFQDIQAWRSPIQVGFFRTLLGKNDPRLIIKGHNSESVVESEDRRQSNWPPTAEAAVSCYAFGLDASQTETVRLLTQYLPDKQVGQINYAD